MASAYIVEVGDRAAGIVVRVHGGFRFFASERAFHPLETVLHGYGHSAAFSRP